MRSSSGKWRKLGNFNITERDVELLLELFKKKYMDTSQIQKRFWRASRGGQFGALKSCQRRLRQLVAHGMIRRIPQAVKRTEGSKPDLFTLDKNSIPFLLSERGINPRQIDLRPWVNEENNPQVKHLLELTNVQIAWQDACAACATDVETWLDEKEIRAQYINGAGAFVDSQGNTLKKPIADAFTIISWEGKRGYFWLEVDRANINIAHSVLDRPSIGDKVARFLPWEASKEFGQEFGNRPLRKLFITRGNGRMHNMLQVCEQVIKRRVEVQDIVSEAEKQTEFSRLAKRFLFTTFDLYYAHNPLTQPIWYTVGNDAPQILLR